jgi:hypothetical protein
LNARWKKPSRQRPGGEPPLTENDFSAPIIDRHKLAGYMITKRALDDGLAEAPHTRKVSLPL